MSTEKTSWGSLLGTFFKFALWGMFGTIMAFLIITELLYLLIVPH